MKQHTLNCLLEVLQVHGFAKKNHAYMSKNKGFSFR